MAGKGRGVAAFTFNIEALGITRGSMPETQQGPRALFPQAEFKPVPLKTGEDEDYMLALKQEIRGRMKGLPFNIKPHSAKRNVERYKEKYTRECNQIEDEEWTPDGHLQMLRNAERFRAKITRLFCLNSMSLKREVRSQMMRKRRKHKRRKMTMRKKLLKEKNMMKKSSRRRMTT
ncbi:DNA-directed RNA polymerase III subunit RPC7 isoform X2 [Electrophorus electricus]|uniref:DNA-directed RNA polymerase III subunit RPC7 isoform X2 n=1 Tax=Electrophorus electricus TaxID=8005 RepID=UPI0015D03F74|nr:DNA-directed RNA polymerase III subunit RPC7 isoform X2 [Electrophorus electricus]